MFTRNELELAENELKEALIRRDRARTEVKIARNKMKMIKDSTVFVGNGDKIYKTANAMSVDHASLKQEFAQVFEPEPGPKRKQHQLQGWTADQIIATNLERTEKGRPPLYGSDEALEDLAKQPPAA